MLQWSTPKLHQHAPLTASLVCLEPWLHSLHMSSRGVRLCDLCPTCGAISFTLQYSILLYIRNGTTSPCDCTTKGAEFNLAA
jgi:hypothetical protein